MIWCCPFHVELCTSSKKLQNVLHSSAMKIIRNLNFSLEDRYEVKIVLSGNCDWNKFAQDLLFRFCSCRPGLAGAKSYTYLYICLMILEHYSEKKIWLVPGWKSHACPAGSYW
jgi:hypothetical protein